MRSIVRINKETLEQLTIHEIMENIYKIYEAGMKGTPDYLMNTKVLTYEEYLEFQKMDDECKRLYLELKED